MRVRVALTAAVLVALSPVTAVTAVGAGAPPRLTAQAPGFSPDGDLAQDKLFLEYQTFNSGVLALKIANSGGHAVGIRVISTALAGPSLAFAEIPAGTGSYSWDGRVGLVNANGTGANTLPDGQYRVALVVMRPKDPANTCSLDDAGCYTEDVSSAVRTQIMAADPKITVSVGGTLYPAKDGYLDSVRLGATFPGTAGYVVVLQDAQKRPIRSWTGVTALWSTIWAGQDAAGGTVQPGKYELSATATGKYGNPDVVKSASVLVAAGRLTPVTQSRTVTPQSVTTRVMLGSCSSIFSYGRNAKSWAGAHRYRSMSKTSGCRSAEAGSDLSLGIYAYPLPAAADYGSVKLTAQGRSCSKRVDNRAGMFFTDNSAGVNLGAKYKKYSTRYVSYAALGGTRTIAWLAGTTRSNCYDVRRFTITWTAHVVKG
jgi:hypothetical protein